jgi:hypothetical protein
MHGFVTVESASLAPKSMAESRNARWSPFFT